MNGSFVKFISERLPGILLYINSTASLFIGIAAQTIGFIILARFLGTEQYGHLATISAAANLGVPWCGLGASEAMRRRVSRDHNAYATMLGHCLIILGVSGLAISIVLSIGLALFVRVVPDPINNLVVIGLLVSCNTILYTWLVFVEQIFLAHSQFKRANIVNASFGIARALTIVVACLGFGVDTLKSWALWNAGGYVVASLAGVAAIWHYGKPRWQLIRDELTLGATISGSGFLWAVRQNVDVLALSVVEAPSVIGAYGIARRIIGTASTVGASLDRLIYPKLAVAGKRGPVATLELARRYVAYGLAIAIPTSTAIFLFAPLLPWIFGAGYSSSVLMLKVLCWTIVLSIVQNVAFDALNAAEQHRARFVAGTAAGVFGIVTIGLLTYLYGIRGAFVGSYISDGIMVIALWRTLFILARHIRRSS